LDGVVSRWVSEAVVTESAWAVAVPVDVVVVVALVMVVVVVAIGTVGAVVVVVVVVESLALSYGIAFSSSGCDSGKEDGELGKTGADNLRGDFNLSCMTIGGNALGFRAVDPELCGLMSDAFFRLIVGTLGSIRGLVGSAVAPGCFCPDGAGDVTVDVVVVVVADDVTLTDAFESMGSVM
jgi:hypothetical protein